MVIVPLLICLIIVFAVNKKETTTKRDMYSQYLENHGRGYNLLYEYVGACFFAKIENCLVQKYIDSGCDADTAKQKASIDLTGGVYKETPLIMARKMIWMEGYIPSNMTGRGAYKNLEFYVPEMPPNGWLRAWSAYIPPCTITDYPESGMYRAIVYRQNQRSTPPLGDWKISYSGKLLTLSDESVYILYKYFYYLFDKYIREYGAKYGCSVSAEYLEWFAEKYIKAESKGE